MRQAILSDVHGNLEAIQAVLEDIRSQKIERIICLGDIVGYGPDPRECVDLAMQFDLNILGNHDQGALFDPEGFSSGAEKAIFWTRAQLEQENSDAEAACKRWQFLAELPRCHREDGRQYVHGSPRDPLHEYVFPEDIHNTRKIEILFSLVESVCFQGHTHVPGIFSPELGFVSSADLPTGYLIMPGKKAMVNVGSVGQPRDGDSRSCYAIVDQDCVHFRRVEYDVSKTVAKIHAEPDLDDFLGDRLLEGR